MLGVDKATVIESVEVDAVLNAVVAYVRPAQGDEAPLRTLRSACPRL
jgi:hypothetical protein